MANDSEQVLKDLGLNETEIKTYLGLLQFGTTSASVLGKRLNLARSTARHTLQQLVKKQLASSTQKNGAFLFVPADPKRILHLLDMEKREIEHREAKAQKIIGDLQQMMNPHIALPKVEFFEGVEGIKRMYEDVLKYNTNIYGFSQVDHEALHPEIAKFFEDVYRPARKKLGNKAFMLFNTQNREEYQKNDSAMNRITLYIPDSFPFSVCFHLYANRICLYSRNANDLFGVIIEHEEIKKSMFSLFQMAWSFALMLPENTEFQHIQL